MQRVVGASAWIAAMLEVECALAAAEEEAGVIGRGAARAIADAAATLKLDPDALRSDGARAGTPVIPLVATLSGAAGAAGGFVHFGATSQDVVDTALALVSRRAVAVLSADLAEVGRLLAGLARTHRHSVMPGRTLLQHGSPTTFGLKAAGWLVAVLDSHAELARAARSLPLQLGGAVGTLAVLGQRASAVVGGLGARLDLPVPTLPWHANRVPVARLGAALGIAAGTLGKIAGDLVLLAQTEIAEVAERREPGRGVSSAMPQKRNPAASIAAIAAARRAAPLAAALLGGLDHEHERAAGAWQAEAPLLVDLFGCVARAAVELRRALDGLEVDAVRMRANLDPSGAWAADAIAAQLAPSLGRAGAHDFVRDASARGALRTDPRFVALLADPLAAAGPADEWIDAALARHAESELAPA
jgi:3-carboxy-cis,cis-muconate cycloisomerase